MRVSTCQFEGAISKSTADGRDAGAQVIEMAPVGAAADIWSVGCLALELLTGAPPYFQLQPMSALFRIVQDDRPPLPDGLSREMRDFLLLCFQKVQIFSCFRHLLQTWTLPQDRKTRVGPEYPLNCLKQPSMPLSLPLNPACAVRLLLCIHLQLYTSQVSTYSQLQPMTFSADNTVLHHVAAYGACRTRRSGRTRTP